MKFTSGKFPTGMSLPYVRGGDERARIEAAYREHMGREFDSGEPLSADFGAPRPDEYERAEDGVRVWSDDYYAAFDAWLASDGHAAYLAARRVFGDRHEQFTYSPRKRNRAEVLAGAAA